MTTEKELCPDKLEIDSIPYTVTERLGTGQTFLAVSDRDDQNICVVKKVEWDSCSETSSDMVVGRLKKLSEDYQHQYILNIEKVLLQESTLTLVTQYAEGGSLHGVVSRSAKEDEALNEVEILDWFLQMLQVLQHLHSKGLVQGYWEIGKIYLKNNRIKLGHCWEIQRVLEKPALLEDKHKTSSTSGTILLAETSKSQLQYLAPEVLQGDTHFTFHSDIWSLGCVLYEICAQKQLHAMTHLPLPLFPRGYHPEIAQIWLKMMSRNPDDRPSANDILHIPFFSDHLQEMEETTHTFSEVPVTEDERLSSPFCSSLSQLSLEEADLELDSDDEREILTGRREPLR